MLVAPLAVVPGAGARGLSEQLAPLPSARNAHAAVSTGEAFYVFGGYANAFLDQIVKYDPQSDTMEVLEAKLPSPRIWASAAWTGKHAYVFGGNTAWGEFTDQVVRFDPHKGQVKVMDAKLPTGRSYTTSVWDGESIWVFGGNKGLGWSALLDDVLRYDPATDTLEQVGVLPYGTDWMSGVWTGEAIYLFGGSGGLGQVLKYIPGDERAETTLATFTGPLKGTSAVWDGEAAYIFGGWPLGSWHAAPSAPTVWKFRPDLCILDLIELPELCEVLSELPEVVLLHDVLPEPRANTAAVWHEGHAYILGGSRVALAEASIADNLRYKPGFEGVLQTPRFTTWLTGLVDIIPGFSEPEEVVARLLDAPGDLEVRSNRWVWDTLSVPDGHHDLRLDTDGRGGQRDADHLRVGVDNLPPVVALTQPAEGEVWADGERVAEGLDLTMVVGALALKATATDAASGVARVEFLVDGVVRSTKAGGGGAYLWSWEAGREAAGEHVLQVRATDGVGHVALTEPLGVFTLPTGVQGLLATLDAAT